MASNPGCVSTLIYEKKTRECCTIETMNGRRLDQPKPPEGKCAKHPKKITRDANHVISQPSDPVEKILHLCQVFSSKQTGLNKKLKKIQIVR